MYVQNSPQLLSLLFLCFLSTVYNHCYAFFFHTYTGLLLSVKMKQRHYTLLSRHTISTREEIYSLFLKRPVNPPGPPGHHPSLVFCLSHLSISSRPTPPPASPAVLHLDVGLGEGWERTPSISLRGHVRYVCAVGGCWSFQEAKRAVLWIKLNDMALGWCFCIKHAFNGLILANNICHDLGT